MATIAETRTALVEEFREDAKREIAAKGETREALARILEGLKAIAARQELWNDKDFPAPEPGERQARHLIASDESAAYALYLNVMRPGKRIPPHNHTTWACIAGVEGAEHNTLYKRLDDGAESGKARIEIDREVVIEPGSGVAMTGDDIHSVEIKGDQIIRHLHMYGRALETLTERIVFDMAEGTCRTMDIGVKTRTGAQRGDR